MTIEISESDFRGIEDALGEIKAAVVRLRMGTEQQKAEKREELLTQINYQANAIENTLLNGMIADEEEVEREVEARR